MKANELMIGDWVYNQFTRKTLRLTFGRDLDLVEELCLEPIPLTKEILEKNGWKKEDVFGSLIKYRFNGPIDIETGGETFRLSNNYFFCGGIHYVHELQHALRMCGVEKDITI